MRDKRRGTRRTSPVQFNRRCYDRRRKVFYTKRRIHLGDTQAMGGTVYYAQYWFFIGEAREEFLKYLLKENLSHLISSGVFLVTVDCSGKYIKSLNAYEEIKTEVKVSKISRLKVYLAFTILNEAEEKVFEAKMTIGLIEGEKPARLPDMITDPIERHFL